MAERITNRDLDGVCRRINRMVNGDVPDGTGTPLDIGPIYDPATRKARIGKFYIDGAYGGVALYRVTGEGGGVTDVFNIGHVPKRELYQAMRAYCAGLERGCRGISDVS